MSLDFQFQFCHQPGQAAGVTQSPKSGNVPATESTIASGCDTLREFLKAADAPAPDRNGCYHPHIADCSKVEVFFDQPQDQSDFSSGTVRLYGISIDNMRFLFALAEQGDLVILPAQAEGTAIVTSESNAQQVSSRYPDTLAVTTPGELMAVLKEGRETLPTFRKEAVAEMTAKSKRPLSSGYMTLLKSVVLYAVLRGCFFALVFIAKNAGSTSWMPWNFLATSVGILSLAVLITGSLISVIHIAEDKGYTGELGFFLVFMVPISLFLIAFMTGYFLPKDEGNYLMGSMYILRIAVLLQIWFSSIVSLFIHPFLGFCILALLPYKFRPKYEDMFPA
ncbi:hypothetical protein [Gimesia maris]|uniref:hypothetical protein n=1 Tax=Gimesia maris TaxID=122 RepID=UPI00241E48C5|nr:hypothetical protein [Gimesia maris]|tara:strand:- start:243290 stop:244297 length:1008 start_codon:yes stop_codon:yes gene_type:complete